jgi:hypothetical protein
VYQCLYPESVGHKDYRALCRSRSCRPARVQQHVSSSTCPAARVQQHVSANTCQQVRIDKIEAALTPGWAVVGGGCPHGGPVLPVAQSQPPRTSTITSITTANIRRETTLCPARDYFTHAPSLLPIFAFYLHILARLHSRPWLRVDSSTPRTQPSSVYVSRPLGQAEHPP